MLTMQALFFIALSHAHFCFEVHKRLSDRSISKRFSKSDAPPRAQLQELSAQDSIDRLQMLCMSVLLLSGVVESELKCCSSPLSVEKMLGVRV